jgi:hypothetical protein
VQDSTDRPASTTSPSGATTRAPRVVGWLALAGVSLIAGISSYFHALAVVQAAGATPPVSYLVPALADLVILGASADLLAASRAGQPRPRLTMLALAVGVVVTLAMNVAAGWGHGLGGRLVAGWPALAFILALESLAGLVRRGRGGASTAPAPAASGQPGMPVVPSTAEALQTLLVTDSRRKLADALGVPKSRVDSWARMVRQVDWAAEPEPALPDPGHTLNGSGPHDPNE